MTTPGGTSATSTADQFTYVVAADRDRRQPGVRARPRAAPRDDHRHELHRRDRRQVRRQRRDYVHRQQRDPITATAPAGAGRGRRDRDDPGGGTSATSASDQYFTYVPPTITSVSPTAGPTAGGTSVTITGTGFTGATAVKFGATAATAFTVNSATQITATAPAGVAGTVDITVTTPAAPARPAPTTSSPTPRADGHGVSPTAGPTAAAPA